MRYLRRHYGDSGQLPARNERTRYTAIASGFPRMDAAAPRDIECSRQEHIGLGYRVGDKREMLCNCQRNVGNRVWWLKRAKTPRIT